MAIQRAHHAAVARKNASGGGGGAIAFVGTVGSVHTTAEGTTLNIPINATVLAGDLIILMVVCANVISTPSGYNPDLSFPDDCEAKFFSKVAAGGETTVAVTTLTGHSVGFSRVIRNQAASPLDQTVATNNQTDPLSAGTTGTTTVPDEAVFAGAAYPAPGGLPTLNAGPAGYTTVSEVSTGTAGSFGLVAGHFADKIISATGAQTASFDLSSATPGGNSGSGGIVTYKQA